ncbi:hypothetical protein [Caldivirga sp.]|nr:hypothetical protein [Caldivirga sp.]
MSSIRVLSLLTAPRLDGCGFFPWGVPYPQTPLTEEASPTQYHPSADGGG